MKKKKNNNEITKTVKVEIQKFVGYESLLIDLLLNILMREFIEIKKRGIEVLWKWMGFSDSYKQSFNFNPKPESILFNDKGKAYNSIQGYVDYLIRQNKLSNTGNISTIVQSEIMPKWNVFIEKLKDYSAHIIDKYPSLPSMNAMEIIIKSNNIRSLTYDEKSKTFQCKLSLLGTNKEKLDELDLLVKNKLEDDRIDKEVKAKMSEMRKKGEKIIKGVTYKKLRDSIKRKTDEELLAEDKIFQNGQFPVILKTDEKYDNHTILKRILDGEYKLGTTKIVKKKNKYYLHMSYSFIPETKSLDPNKILGVDLGINTPVVMAVNDSYERCFINGDEIIAYRTKMKNQRKKYQRQAAYCGDGRRGHGKKKLLEKINRLKNKESEWCKTKNNVYSRRVIDFAIKNNCGTIQIENLTGIADNEKKATFLGDWTYYQLQNMIEYKAKEVGIQVIKVKPKHTSARCSQCGHIHSSKDKKIWRPKQEQFKCMNCDYGHKYFVHADYNAARNIATPNIEEIIKKHKDFQYNIIA